MQIFTCRASMRECSSSSKRRTGHPIATHHVRTTQPYLQLMMNFSVIQEYPLSPTACGAHRISTLSASPCPSYALGPSFIKAMHSPLPVAEDIQDIWKASPNITCPNTQAQRLLDQDQRMLAQFLFSLPSIFHFMRTRYSFQPIALGRLPCDLLTCRTIAPSSAM